LNDEISRLFRSNAFNIQSRKAFHEEREKRFWALKSPPATEKYDDKIKRLEARAKIPKEPYTI
jgi:hypothetical protein